MRQEWQFAWFEAEKFVTPILRQEDFPLIPDERTLLHIEDFRNDNDYDFHLEQLARILKESAPPLGKLIGVPALPAHYLARTDRRISLRDAVRCGLDRAAPFGDMAARQQFHGIAVVSKHVGIGLYPERIVPHSPELPRFAATLGNGSPFAFFTLKALRHSWMNRG